MIDKKFYKPATITKWVVVIYDRVQRFGEAQAKEMVKGLMDACAQVGQ